MRIAFTIAILLIGLISVRSQDFYVSPGYYPIEMEIVQEWYPSESSSINFNAEPEYGSALPSWWEEHRKGVAVTAIQIASIILDATGDAVYDIGKESGNDSQMFWGHTMQGVAIGGMGVSTAMLVWEGNVWDGVRFGVGYVAMRYAIFDLSYNLARGIDPLYADGLKAKMEPGGRAFTQILAFSFSVSFNICEF